MYVNEFQVRTRDQSYRHFRVQAVPIIARDGAVHEWIGAAVDITEERDRINRSAPMRRSRPCSADQYDGRTSSGTGA